MEATFELFWTRLKTMQEAKRRAELKPSHATAKPVQAKPSQAKPSKAKQSGAKTHEAKPSKGTPSRAN